MALQNAGDTRFIKCIFSGSAPRCLQSNGALKSKSSGYENAARDEVSGGADTSVMDADTSVMESEAVEVEVESLPALLSPSSSAEEDMTGDETVALA